LLAPNGRPIQDNFRDWFGSSKVLGADGLPLVVYHGSLATFDVFDPSRFGQTDEGLFGHGFYFSDSQAYASSYGPCRPFFLCIENPVFVGSEDDDRNYRFLKDLADPEEGEGPESVMAWMQAEGHDGIIVMSQAGTTEYIVYEPWRIKSAGLNSGLYLRDSDSVADTVDQVSLSKLRFR
jgi:hypothetical protein